MPKGNPGKPRPRWQRVEEARDLLNSNAKKVVKDLLTASAVASKKGDSRPAEFILTHIATVNDEGKEVRPLTANLDKQLGDGGPTGPQIHIGIAFKGLMGPAVTPVTQVIDITPTPSPSESPTLERKPAELPVIEGESDNVD